MTTAIQELPESDCATEPGRRIAFLSYYFPPLGGGGTPRSAKFVKYLPQSGFRPVVFTVDSPSVAGAREFQTDATQHADLDDARFDVIRIVDPARDRSRWKHAGMNLFPLAWAIAYPWLWEQQRGWSMRVADAIIREGRRLPFRLIYVSAAPNSAIEAASLASRALRIPFVVDLRDLWTRETIKFFPSKLHYLWESHHERRLLSQASSIIANTEGSARLLTQWLGSSVSKRIAVIPNGFDPAEFQAPAPCRSTCGKPITIVHAGTLYRPGIRRSRLGRYRPLAIDDEARSPLPLARAIAILKQRTPLLASRIRVRLIGFSPDESRHAVQKMGVGGSFHFEGILSRDDALRAIRSADALLVLQVAFADGHRPVPYVPGKVFDYLATGAPILAPIPPGDLRDLLESAPQAYVCGHRDDSEIAASIERLVCDLDSASVCTCDRRWLERFSRESQARQLASVLSEVIGASVRL